jgi:glycosyltransferase involved in cell wall biosynthesis
VTRQKITVVIPTRERLPVLRYSMQTVLSQPYEMLQVLVSDNYSTDGTGDFVRGLSDPRLRYVNSGRRLSMSENWEFALSHVEDGWVMFLGDDDGLLPGAIERLAAIIEATDCEAVTFRPCNYIWPRFGYEVARLKVPFSRGWEVRDSSKWLQCVMDSGVTYYSLPMIYVLGVVDMALISRIRLQGQRFFNSCIPDVYASIALARSTPKYLYVNEPFTIIGCSEFSSGAQFVISGDQGESGNELNRFMTEGNMPFHPDIPLRRDGGYPLSLQMLVYEAYLQSKFLQPHAAGPRIERQLALALARPYTSSLYEARNQEWGRDFARQHRLDFDAILAQSKTLRRAAKLGHWVRRIRSPLETMVVYDPAVSLPNVFVASIFASSLLWIRPSIFVRLSKAFRRLAGRIKAGGGGGLWANRGACGAQRKPFRAGSAVKLWGNRSIARRVIK